MSAVAFDAVELAFRARAASLVVCSTGALSLEVIALSTTQAQLVRTVGDFEADGFAVGMEAATSGLPADLVGVVVDVTALTMTLDGVAALDVAAAAGRSVSAGLPALRFWENTSGDPQPLQCYVETELLPQPGELLSAPADGGTVEYLGLWVLRWCVPHDVGAVGMRRGTSALLALLTPHTKLIAGAHVVRMRGDSVGYAGGITRRDDTHAMQVVTVPWRLYARNVIAP